MYSQNNEEEIILSKLASSTGRFLEIGAYDGKKFSNTFALLQKGWSGVMIEPSPSVFVRLMENTHEFQDRLSLVNSAIEAESKIMEFHDSGGDAISTFDLNHKDKWEKGSSVKFRKLFVKTITVEEIFALFGCDFEFINIDVEGQNYPLYSKIKGMVSRGELPALKLLCVEHDGKNKEIEQEMKHFGFQKILFNGENIILWKS